MQIVVKRHKSIMRLGFMHMVAANICVWIATTVKETHQEFVMYGSQHPSTTAHSPSATAATYHSHEDHDSDHGKSSSELLTNITDGEFIQLADDTLWTLFKGSLYICLLNCLSHSSRLLYCVKMMKQVIHSVFEAT